MSKFKDLAHAATRKVSKQVLITQKNSPTILIAFGVPAVITAAVLACRATLKVGDVLADGEELLVTIEKHSDDSKDNEGGSHAAEETKKKTFKVQIQTATRIARLYAPSVVLGVAGIAALTGSHVILKRRNAALGAAYAIVDKGFKEYRARVVEDQGKQKDLEYAYGVVEKEIVEEGPNGPEVKVIRGLDQKAVDEASDVSTYARVFSEKNSTEWTPVPTANRFRITAVQKQLNDELRLRGHVFLNQAYELLGFKVTQAGQQVGWVKNPKLGQGDGYIDFGLDQPVNREFVTGQTSDVLVEFNVDGNVLAILDKM